MLANVDPHSPGRLGICELPFHFNERERLLQPLRGHDFIAAKANYI